MVDVQAQIDSVDRAIGTIDDALRIAEDGRRQRADAARQLEACEAELKGAMLAARDRGRRALPESGRNEDR